MIALNTHFIHAARLPDRLDNHMALFKHCLRWTDEGSQLVSYAESLAARRSDFKRDQIVKSVHNHYRISDQHLNKNSGPVFPGSPYSWFDVDVILLFGLGQLPGGSSLDHLLYEERYKAKAKLSEPLIVYHMLKKYAQDGTMPGLDDPIDLPGESWENIKQCASHGLKGLDKGMGITAIREKYGIRRRHYTEEDIFALSLWHVVHERSFATEDTKHFGGYLMTTGKAVDIALKQKLNGITRQSTLPQVLREQLARQAQKHIARTGYFPQENDDPLPDHPEVSWRMIGEACRNRIGRHATDIKGYLTETGNVRVNGSGLYIEGLTTGPAFPHSPSDFS